MKITLEIVRQVLKAALGFNSFTAGFIRRVEESQSHPTAGITQEGLLIYNPEFVERCISCREDLFSLIFHELLHPMFGHFIYRNGLIENIAADAVINAVISTLYPEASLEGNLFKKTHADNGLDGLMRPMSRMHHSRYARVYNKLYSRYRSSETITTGELIQTLKILTPTENLSTVLLLGTHDGVGIDSKRDGLSGLSMEDLARIAEEIRHSLKAGLNNRGGYSSDLVAMVMEALQQHLSIRRVLLQKFATQRKLDRFKEQGRVRRITASPIPLLPSKRDLVLLFAGIYPFHYHNQLHAPKPRHRGLAIYLDVSGSVNEHLPKIIGILSHLKPEIETIFQFSNQVVETSFKTMLQGHIQTTFGTSFDCIAESILEKKFDKAIILTDGYACLHSDFENRLKERNPSLLTILFGDKERCDDWAPFGDVVQLEDVCI